MNGLDFRLVTSTMATLKENYPQAPVPEVILGVP